MLKIIKLAPIALLALTPNYEVANESSVYLESITIGAGDGYYFIRTYYSVTEANAAGCTFNYSYTTEGELRSAGSSRIDKLDVCTRKRPKDSQNIYFSDIGKNLTFIVEMVPDDKSLPNEKRILRRNTTGEKCVYYEEKNNDEGLSSGYITENYYKNPKYKTICEDRIMFLNFEDNYIIPSYNYFDISIFKFKYLNAKTETPNGKFYFDFIDTYALFEDLPLESGTMYRRLELNLNEDGEILNFTFKNNLYYDPVTHKCSSTYKDGYIETNCLFFPKENFSQLKNLTCRIFMEINGYTDFTLIGSFKITHEKRLFGECENSEYCIEMSQDHNVNKREKEVEVTL